MIINKNLQLLLYRMSFNESLETFGTYRVAFHRSFCAHFLRGFIINSLKTQKSAKAQKLSER